MLWGVFPIILDHSSSILDFLKIKCHFHFGTVYKRSMWRSLYFTNNPPKFLFPAIKLYWHVIWRCNYYRLMLLSQENVFHTHNISQKWEESHMMLKKSPCRFVQKALLEGGSWNGSCPKSLLKAQVLHFSSSEVLLHISSTYKIISRLHDIIRYHNLRANSI